MQHPFVIYSLFGKRYNIYVEIKNSITKVLHGNKHAHLHVQLREEPHERYL